MIYSFTYKLGDSYYHHTFESEETALSYFSILLSFHVEYIKVITHTRKRGVL